MPMNVEWTVSCMHARRSRFQQPHHFFAAGEFYRLDVGSVCHTAKAETAPQQIPCQGLSHQSHWEGCSSGQSTPLQGNSSHLATESKRCFSLVCQPNTLTSLRHR